MINEHINEEFDTETNDFAGEDIALVITALYDDDHIEWKCLSDYPHYLATKGFENALDPDSMGFYFYQFADPTEISREDLIDLIIQIEQKYQAIKDKVVFNG